MEQNIYVIQRWRQYFLDKRHIPMMKGWREVMDLRNWYILNHWRMAFIEDIEYFMEIIWVIHAQ